MTPSIHYVVIVGVPNRTLVAEEISLMSNYIRNFFAPQLFVLNANTIFASTVFIHEESDPKTFLEILGLNTILKTFVQNFSVEVSVTAKTADNEFTAKFANVTPVKKQIFHICMVVGDLHYFPQNIESVFSQNKFLHQIRTFRNSTHMAFYASEDDFGNFDKNNSIVYSTFRSLACKNRAIHIMSFSHSTKKIIYEDIF